MARVPRPKPLRGSNPGLRDAAPHGMAGASGKPPAVVRIGEDVVKMGMSAAKSAGHKAHDILHGIGL